MQLKITLLQNDIIWEDIDANLHRLSNVVNTIPEIGDLLVLPEMFSCGFSMNTEKIAETMDGRVVQWMKMVANERNCVLTGSHAIVEGGKYYNRALWVSPNGKLDYYDKRHLFSPGFESEHFSRGKNRKVFDLKGIKVLPQVCYDLRFPVWSRNNKDYDLAVYMANWPAARMNVWDILLKARAIENQCYVIGVNRAGEGGGIKYSGGTCCINYKGEELVNLNSTKENYSTIILDFNKQKEFVNKFPVHLDADNYTIEN